MGKRPKKTLYPREYTNGKQEHLKQHMLARNIDEKGILGTLVQLGQGGT